MGPVGPRGPSQTRIALGPWGAGGACRASGTREPCGAGWPRSTRRAAQFDVQRDLMRRLGVFLAVQRQHRARRTQRRGQQPAKVGGGVGHPLLHRGRHIQANKLGRRAHVGQCPGAGRIGAGQGAELDLVLSPGTGDGAGLDAASHVEPAHVDHQAGGRDVGRLRACRQAVQGLKRTRPRAGPPISSRAADAKLPSGSALLTWVSPISIALSACAGGLTARPIRAAPSRGKKLTHGAGLSGGAGDRPADVSRLERRRHAC